MVLIKKVLIILYALTFFYGTNSFASQVFDDQDFVIVPELNGLMVQKTELTFAQWDAVAVYFSDWQIKKPWEKSDVLPDGCVHPKFIIYQPNHPVSCLDWFDVNGYIRVLNQIDSKYEYRLPTDSEFNKLVDLSLREFSRTNEGAWYDSLDKVAWYQENAGNFIHAVAQKASLLGLYDIIGNVSEWTSTKAGPGHHEFYICGRNVITAEKKLLDGNSCYWFYEEVRKSTHGFRLIRSKK
jgi:formylglycine-generating enzyme required for sulfatase activity